MGKLFQEIEMKASLLRASSQVFLKHDFTWDASWCESKQKIENISWRNLSFSVPTVCGSSRPNISLKQSYTTNLIIFYSSYNSYKCKYTLHAIFSHKNKSSSLVNSLMKFTINMRSLQHFFLKEAHQNWKEPIQFLSLSQRVESIEIFLGENWHFL